MTLAQFKRKSMLWFCRKTGVLPPNPVFFVWLCKNGSAKEIERAVRNGADVNAMFEGAISGLMFALSNKRDAKIIETVLDVGCDPNLIGANGETALMIACARGYGGDVIGLLLDYGADASIKTSNEKTALDFAVDAGNKSAEESLKNFTHEVNDV